MPPRKRVAHGHPACKVLYTWNGRPTFWGARAFAVVRRAERLATDPRASDIRVRIDGVEYAPEDVELVR